MNKGECPDVLKDPKQADINEQNQPDKHAPAEHTNELAEDDLPVVQRRRQ